MFAILGVILLIAGAVMRFAIQDTVNNANLHTIGVILMAGGALSLIIAAIQGMGWMSMGHRHMQSERVVSPDGTHVVEETRTS